MAQETAQHLFGINRNFKRFSDAELVRHYRQKQDVRACAELFKRYSNLVLGIAVKYFKNLPDAEDSSMDIFLELQAKLLKHEVQNFKPWLLTLARNHCLMKLRKTTPQIVELGQQEELAEDLVHSQEEAHHTYASEEELLKHLDELPDVQQNCLKLFYYHNLSYEDIGVKLEMEKEAVRSAIQSGRKRLKRRMNKTGAT